MVSEPATKRAARAAEAPIQSKITLQLDEKDLLLNMLAQNGIEVDLSSPRIQECLESMRMALQQGSESKFPL